MGQFVKTRIRCPIYPSRVNQQFTNIFTGTTPKIYKGAGVDFELSIFDTDTTLFDVSNITDVTLMVKPLGNPTAAAEILKTVSVGIRNVSLDEWDNGQLAQVTVSLLGTDTQIAAGTHDLTIWGHTNDAGSDPDVFGTSKIEVIDAGISSVTNPTLTPTYLTEDQIRALLAGYVTYVMPLGKTLTFQSEDGLYNRILGIGNGPVRIDDFEAK